MSESTSAIVAAVVIAAVGGYLGYRVSKEKKRLKQMVTILNTKDLDLVRSIDELLAKAETKPVTA